eukprot:TCONS_00011660-protein
MFVRLLQRFNELYEYPIHSAWPWNRRGRTRYITFKKHRVKSKQTILLVLFLTSLWWLSFNVLYLLHSRGSALLIFEHENTAHVNKRADLLGRFTPPVLRHSRIGIPAPTNFPTKPSSLDPVYANTQASSKFSDNPNEQDAKLKDSEQSILSLEVYPELVIPSLGYNGEPAVLPQHLKSESMKLFGEHSFDSVLSNRISLNRHLKDNRGEKCRAKVSTYSPNLPDMSIIICFHNEALSTLLRTVHSIIRNTLPHLVTNIILIDDASTKGNLLFHIKRHKLRLRKTVWHNKIILLQNKQRQGIVRSRLNGASLARGKVLTFLDSHCEMNKGWAEPLLHRIKEDRKNVVCPVIEIIDANDFSYKATPTKEIKQVGSFTWNLFFDWKAISPEEDKKRLDETYPLKSPTMAGGLFSMDRSYFFELGTYDDQMDIWGGENLELSFRIWMCGGNLEIIPCSRVGHVFRSKDSPYSFPGGVQKTLNKNFNRLAEVWMDEYKENYYKNKLEEERYTDIGDLSSRKALRHRLGCKSFDWFVKNIVPGMLGTDQNPPASGQIRNLGSDFCIHASRRPGVHHKAVGVAPCSSKGERNQNFVWTKNDEMVYDDQKCLDFSFSNTKRHVELWGCHGLGGNQIWKHHKESGLIIHQVSSMCLAITGQNSKSGRSDLLTVEKCNEKKNSQRWRFTRYANGG